MVSFSGGSRGNGSYSVPTCVFIRSLAVLKLAICSDQLLLASTTFPRRCVTPQRNLSLLLKLSLLFLFVLLLPPWYGGVPLCFAAGLCSPPAEGASAPITAAVAIQFICFRPVLLEFIGGDYPQPTATNRIKIKIYTSIDNLPLIE